MLTAFDDPRARKSEAPPDGDFEGQMEARREIDSWLSEGRPEPTAEQLESVTREWQS
jgi:hypothetical protein